MPKKEGRYFLMKTINYERTLGVECNTIERFNQECDVIAQRLSDANVKFERLWNMNRGQHCCYFIYIETKLVPESIEDKYILEGKEKFCGDCPFFTFKEGGLGTCENPSVKVKTRTGLMQAAGKACPRLYEGLERGDLITDESWRVD